MEPSGEFGGELGAELDTESGTGLLAGLPAFGPAGRRRAGLLGLIVAALAVPGVAAQELIFADGFESNNTLAWSANVGEPLPPADPFRLADLDLRDPHVFIDLPVAGCFDFTDTPLPAGLAPSFNASVETALTTDGDGDGRLDQSVLLLLRPFAAAAVAERLDLAGGRCTAPLPATACERDPAVVPQTVEYDGLAAGSCLAALAGTTSGYVPAPAEPLGPCVRSEIGRPFTLEILGVAVPLLEPALALETVGEPPTGLTGGLLRGFLTEEAAAQVTLPAELPIVGGQPLSVLLPGGAGSCAGGDDRDQLEGQSGWWLYLDAEAGEVPFVGP
jgi:hypothetical protein